MAMNFDNRYTDVAAADELRLTDYLQAIVGNWRLIATIALVVTLAGTGYAFFARPVYKADAVIQVEDVQNGENGGGGNQQQPVEPLSRMFTRKATTAAQIELLKSRLVTEATVRELHLDIAAEPRALPVAGPLLAALTTGKWGFRIEPFMDLGGFAWGDEKIDVARFDTPRALYGKPFTLAAGPSGTLTLNDPDGVAIASGRVGEDVRGVTTAGPVLVHVDRLTARPGTQFRLTRSSTLDTVERLQKALRVTETALQSGVINVMLQGEHAALTADIVNGIARQFIKQDADRRSAEAERTLAFLEEQLPQLRRELDQAEQRYNTFRNNHGTVDLSEESRLLLQQIVDNKTKLADLQRQRADLSQRFTASHPAVAALDAQIGQLQGAQGQMSKSVAQLPDTEQTALRLLRDVRVDTELYTNLLNSAQQLRVVKAGQIGNVRVVDFAETPDEPVWPKRYLVILIAFGGGLFVGIVAAFVKKALYGGVERADEIENAIGVPVFAVVPRSGLQLRLQQNVMMRRQGLHVLAAQSPQDIAVEGVRSLRTTLQLSLDHAPNNIVMVTGSRPDAGKSFLSVNLAALVASAGKRVLVIDGDMRRGEVHSHFGVRHQPGLSDVLRGVDPGSVIQREVLPGLDVLTKGTLPSHPSELLMSERFRDLLDALSRHYDLVIIDTPPVLAVTDSTVIGKYAGTTLLVVRYGRHPISEISETAKRLETGGVNLKGVLLTDVPPAVPMLGGSYNGGYYGYKSIAE
ncbi:polysaccharide biosynthesis tyrosine autokinase [Trinickia caryophylli]|uniref:Putative tyrosine-protein kinase EpsB n=1 Tax=Trinickia caryophylli TaxID=28094 RepID=A0A1X7CFN5_TRICW|nr:polysaccharide biosynthesis tyrosine autokinase [Trinickia caryophylli]PMS11606.1 protein tyrosine kinase [Trinickia caryophylli]TRX19834.1 polysaccharide biosynthesis tyrosine autokinase [Trinickia caryophylli]WQE12834.1 polysaccharide biosynthesis tyrosine autokinase [Trinickia caryophylli]SME95740.1 tyrosine-protein kinase Etk/Wzc [Trinickia caryophylli]GLU30554.1 tyrosine-protein kinase involved in EPS biosynthesis [Trinickia caryophylli]